VTFGAEDIQASGSRCEWHDTGTGEGAVMPLRCTNVRQHHTGMRGRDCVGYVFVYSNETDYRKATYII
jgi:hypothetical protein